jgi:hypothetical protein
MEPKKLRYESVFMFSYMAIIARQHPQQNLYKKNRIVNNLNILVKLAQERTNKLYKIKKKLKKNTKLKLKK